MSLTPQEQQEQLTSFSKKYGLSIAAGVVFALSGFFGWQYYQQNNQIKAYNHTVQLQNLMNLATIVNTDPSAYNKIMTEGAKLVADDPNSAQAVQAQLLMAKLAFDKQDYATANKILTAAQSSKLDDEGLLSIVKLHLAYTQVAQKQLDAALKTLDNIKIEAFIPSVSEAKGDIYVLMNKNEEAKKAYQTAWDALLKRNQPRELLQIKLANLGVVVEMPTIESPINVSNQDEQLSDNAQEQLPVKSEQTEQSVAPENHSQPSSATQTNTKAATENSQKEG